MEPIDIIKLNFEFLISDYHFAITKEKVYPPAYFGAVIIYNSKETQIIVSLDKGDVFIEMGGSFRPSNELHEFTHVIHYLNPEIKKVYISNDEIKVGNLESSVDFQSRRLSELMRENCKQILDSGFTPEMVNQIKELEKNYVTDLFAKWNQTPKKTGIKKYDE